MSGSFSELAALITRHCRALCRLQLTIIRLKDLLIHGVKSFVCVCVCVWVGKCWKFKCFFELHKYSDNVHSVLASFHAALGAIHQGATMRHPWVQHTGCSESFYVCCCTWCSVPCKCPPVCQHSTPIKQVYLPVCSLCSESRVSGSDEGRWVYQAFERCDATFIVQHQHLKWLQWPRW